MEHSFLDRYSELDSPVHRLDPRSKALAVLAFVIVVVSTPPQHLLAFVIYAGLTAWAAALARVPLGYVLLRAAAVLPFSALVALALPFFEGGPTVRVLGGRLELSVQGLWTLAGVTLKSCLGAAAVVLLISTTRFSALLRALRALGMPALFADLLALTYRYLFVLTGEAMRLRRAAAARGYRPRWLGQALLVGRMVGNLFLRSYERAERIYGAMLLRGYSGRLPPSAPLRFRGADLLALAVVVPVLVAVRLLAR